MHAVIEKPPTTEFERAVHRAVQSVPAGRVTTYGDVALAVGRPGAARAVGTVMRCNPDTRATPCHRVVRSDGTVGGYAGGGAGTPRKILRLAAEGVRVDAHARLIDFERIRWRGGRS